MSNLHMQPRAPIPAESLLDFEIRDLLIKEKNALVFTFVDIDKPFKQIDVFLEDKYPLLSQSVDEYELSDKHSLRVINIPALIKMKEEVDPIRDKDQRDIIALRNLGND